MDRLIISFLICLYFIPASAQGADAEVIAQRTSIIVNKGKMTKQITFEIQINKRAGEYCTHVTIPYSKLVKVSKITAHIKDSHGNRVKELRKNDISIRSAITDISLYEDNFVKEFTLRHNSYPYTLVYSYQVSQQEFLYIDHWLPVIHESIPTRQAQLELTVPRTYDIAYKNRWVNEPSIDTVANNIHYLWTCDYTDIIKPESYAPPLLNFFPGVIITPLTFNYDIPGSFTDWSSYGNWQYRLLGGLNELPTEEKERIRELTQDTHDNKEKLRILYHDLQDNTRYINVSIETGGMKPYPASYVVHNKYGDCKALTNYFKSILDYLEIPAYYTNIYAGTPIRETDTSFPSQQANHVILYIPLQDEDIWLDCTSKGAFNYLGTFTQNRNAFIIEPSRSRFLQTPALTPDDNLEIRKVRASLSGDEANVEFTNTYRGTSYETLLTLTKNYNQAEKADIISRYLLNEGFELTNYGINQISRDTAAMTLSCQTSSRNLHSGLGNEMLIRNIPFMLPRFEQPAYRKLPLQFDYPIHKADTITYEIPTGYTLNSKPVQFSIQSQYGEYRIKSYIFANSVVIIKQLLIRAGKYHASEYENFYTFYESVLESENKTHITLRRIQHK